MNTAMEVHDSHLLELHREIDGSGFALFHAVVWRSEGALGQSAQQSGWQNVRMQFTDMIVKGNQGGISPYASDGFLLLDGHRDDGLIPFPISFAGSVILSMELGDDFETTTIQATSISIAPEDNFECEHIWDAEGNRIPSSA